MSKIQGFKRLITEDFEEKDRSLVGKIGFVLNTFAEEVSVALNKNLSISDNLNLAQKDITVTVNGLGVPTTPTNVASGLSNLCRGMQVVRAINQTNPQVSPTSCPFITFVDNAGQINISKITGLQSDNKYLLTVILYP